MFVIEGIQTNAEQMYMMTYQEEFVLGTYNTSFWSQNADVIQERTEQWIFSKH